jgi:hypothetical protein
MVALCRMACAGCPFGCPEANSQIESIPRPRTTVFLQVRDSFASSPFASPAQGECAEGLESLIWRAGPEIAFATSGSLRHANMHSAFRLRSLVAGYGIRRPSRGIYRPLTNRPTFTCDSGRTHDVIYVHFRLLAFACHSLSTKLNVARTLQTVKDYFQNSEKYFSWQQELWRTVQGISQGAYIPSQHFYFTCFPAGNSGSMDADKHGQLILSKAASLAESRYFLWDCFCFRHASIVA